MAGQSINCPHCQLETRLFIPPVVVPQKQSARERKPTTAIVLGVVAFAVLALGGIGVVLKQSKQTAKTLPSNIKPANGAFGWKLGDSLPANLQAQVRDGRLAFKPETSMTPFDQFEMELTGAGKIFKITAKGYAPDQGADSFTCERSIVSLLTEKYGLQSHDRGGDFNTYRFGGTNQMAMLQIFNFNLFELSYLDRELYSVFSDEQEAKRKKDEDEKKAALSKGL